MSKKQKTVFVLGAGASKAVNLPLQAQLLSDIFSLTPTEFDMQMNFMELEINERTESILNYYPEFNKQRTTLADFIVDSFSSESISIDYRNARERRNMKLAFLIVEKINVTLEDLFTIFDKVAMGREHFREYTANHMQNIHTSLQKCIIFILAYRSAMIEKGQSVYNVFADKLIKRRLEASVKEDVLSVITMNWDSVLEQEVYRQCEIYNSNKGPRGKMIYPDLCFYDYPYNKDEKRLVSTQIKAKGHRNIKILKLHGSINWLICPFCGRVFVDYTSDIAIYEYDIKRPCRHCINDLISDNGNYENAPNLRSIMITPTFIKDLNNLHLQNIWHNAFIDIKEADRLVFIGYSFPDADFEMRYLLKKAVRNNTYIDVVLHKTDSPELFKKNLENKNLKDDEIKTMVSKMSLPENRYSSFFNKDRLHFFYSGIEEYLKIF